MITPEYIDALGIRVTKGRNITEHDIATSPRVAIVNEHFANRFFPNADPVGQKFLADEIIPEKREDNDRVADRSVFYNVRGATRSDEVFRDLRAVCAKPVAAGFDGGEDEWRSKSVIRSISAAVNSVDPDLPLAGVRTLDGIIDEALAIDRFSMVLFSCFGVLGLVLSAVGITASWLSRLRNARMSLVFAWRSVHSVRESSTGSEEGTVLALTGAAIGLVGAYFVGRAMQSTLFGVEAIDLRAFGAVSFLLLMAALLACWVPAWRASRVEPLEALRYSEIRLANVYGYSVRTKVAP